MPLSPDIDTELFRHQAERIGKRNIAGAFTNRAVMGRYSRHAKRFETVEFGQMQKSDQAASSTC